METVLTILAVICALAGIAGCILPALPGPPVCYAGLLLAHLAGLDISSRTLIITAVATVFVTLADYYLPIWFTKRFGGSRYATWGSMVGIIAGLFFLPVGIVIGPFLGALLGELLNDRTDMSKAFRVAFGSFAAFFLGTGVKLITAVWMTIIIIKAF